MKIVREHIFEKFTEDSDPITDMGIGVENIIKNWAEKIYKLDISRSEYYPETNHIDLKNNCIIIQTRSNVEEVEESKDYFLKILDDLHLSQFFNKIEHYCFKEKYQHGFSANICEFQFAIKPEYIKFFKKDKKFDWRKLK